jgi:hypothetical protein
MNIGTGAAARTITVGNVTGDTALALNAGTGGIALASTGAGDITLNSDDTLLLDADGVLELNSSAGAINIGNDDIDQAINIGTQGERTISIGTGAFADTINLGNATGATAVSITSGTGSIALASTGTGDITINSDDTLLLDADGVIEINSSAGAIGIGSDNDAQAINIGTGYAARTITMGNTTGATSLVLNSGTGGINLQNSTILTSTLSVQGNYMQYKNKTSTSWTQVGYQENFSSGLKVTGSTNIAGTLSVSGHTTISGDLMVGGNLNIANKLSVGGNSYFSNVNIRHNIKIDERPANIGAGILAAGNLAAWNNLRFGVMYKNELFINLIGLRSDGDSDVIGKQGGTANSHFGQITYEKFGFVKSISMRCLERADSSYRQFYLATDSSSLSEGDDGSGINHLTGGSVNMASVGQINVYPISSATITSDINNHFIYLLGGGGVDYTTGMFLITFFGW